MSETGVVSGAEAGRAVTITYLEMTAPPARPVPPQPITPGGGALVLLYAEAPPVDYFLHLYRMVGADYDWTDLLTVPEAELAAFVGDRAVELMVLHHRGVPAGFYQLDFRRAGVCDLAYFGLAPRAIGMKLGPWLLATAIHSAWSPLRGERSAAEAAPVIEKMTVNTCTLDHPAALPLYQRWGFVPVRRETKTRP